MKVRLTDDLSSSEMLFWISVGSYFVVVSGGAQTLMIVVIQHIFDRDQTLSPGALTLLKVSLLPGLVALTVWLITVN